MGIFSERVKNLRESKGISQRQAAKDLNISPQNLSYYEKGRDAGYDLLIRMAQYYDVTVEYLIGVSTAQHRDNIGINEVTGLSDGSLDYLKKNKTNNGNTAAEIINTIVVMSSFKMLVNLINDKDKDIKEVQEDIADSKIKDILTMDKEQQKAILSKLLPMYKEDVSKLRDFEIERCINDIAHKLKLKYENNLTVFFDGI